MSYTRNFEFRVPPHSGQRGARYKVSAETVIGAPIKVADGATPDALGLLPAALATGAQVPKKGTCGIAVYEYIGFTGDDGFLTTYSDKDTVPAGAAVQCVSGDKVKVCFRNTVDRTFLNTREYDGRMMVAGAGATPTVAVGDFLTPGTGNDAAGYWAETGSATNAWLVVTRVDTTRGEVEAEMVF